MSVSLEDYLKREYIVGRIVKLHGRRPIRPMTASERRAKYIANGMAFGQANGALPIDRDCIDGRVVRNPHA